MQFLKMEVFYLYPRAGKKYMVKVPVLKIHPVRIFVFMTSFRSP